MRMLITTGKVVAIMGLLMIQRAEPVTQEHVYLNKKIMENDHSVKIFETKSGLSTERCVEACKPRKGCSFINYHRTTQVCYMLQAGPKAATPEITYSVGFMFGNKSDWSMMLQDERCTNCTDPETCQLSNSPRCLITGCGTPPAVDKMTIVGNSYVVGSVLSYKCKYKYKMNEGSQSQITCQENGTWTDSKIECISPCNDPWTWHYGNSCYLLDIEERSWDEAKKNCEDKDAHLVDIGSQDEADFLNKRLTDGNHSDSYMFIGLNDKQKEGEFRWSDATVLDDNMKNNWSENNVDNYRDDEDCVELLDTKWYEYGCSNKMFSVCEYEI